MSKKQKKTNKTTKKPKNSEPIKPAKPVKNGKPGAAEKQEKPVVTAVPEKTPPPKEQATPATPATGKSNVPGILLKAVVPVIIILIVLYFVIWPGISISMKKDQLKEMNVILITIDTLRADHVSAYVKGKADTPHMDGLAKGGVLFRHCVAQTPLTLPSHTSILSGTYPLFHQVRDNGGFLVPEKLDLVSEVLQKQGVKTSAFIAAYVLHSKWGMNQGFDTYSDKFDLTKYKTMLLQNEKPCEEVLNDAKQWIKSNKNEKFFSWIHLYDPHTPYRPPSPFKERNPNKPYSGEVEYVDDQLGKFIDFLKAEGLYSKSLIIVTSDHGEGLGDFGEMEHGYYIYEPTVWVPLIVHAPFEFPQKEIAATVEHVDLAPTILEALGIPAPASYQGRSLLSAMLGEEELKNKMAYTETFYPRFHFGWSELKGFYNQKWKYIHAPKEELFDLETDRKELKNLALIKSFDKNKVKEKALTFEAQMVRGAIAPGKAENLDKGDLKRLQALGYITSTVDTSNKTDLADPKSKVEIYNDFMKATELADTDKTDEAIATLKDLIRKDPDVIDAYTLMGNAYMKKKAFKEALPCFYKVLEKRPSANFTMINVLLCLKRMGDYDKAKVEAEKFIKLFPEDSTLLEQLGNIHFEKNDMEGATKYLEKALTHDPNNMGAILKLGKIYLLKENLKAARRVLEKGIVIKPDAKRIHYFMGQVLELEGDLKKANEYYEKELEYNPDLFEAPFNIAGNLRKLGDTAGAITYYRKTISSNPNYNKPYFIIAEYYLKTNQQLQEAINLCKQGVAIKPYNESTLFGYFILTNIYARLGDKANFDLYTSKGEQLYKALQKQKK